VEEQRIYIIRFSNKTYKVLNQKPLFLAKAILMNVVLVFIGGGLGCVLRYLIGIGFQRTSVSLPWGTFFSNITSCLIFSLVIWYLRHKERPDQFLQVVLLTGFCGGLSTFSTFGYETFLLLKQGLHFYAFLNILVSVALCLFIFYMFN
jgi:fluoride exporter